MIPCSEYDTFNHNKKLLQSLKFNENNINNKLTGNKQQLKTSLSIFTKTLIEIPCLYINKSIVWQTRNIPPKYGYIETKPQNH